MQTGGRQTIFFTLKCIVTGSGCMIKRPKLITDSDNSTPYPSLFPLPIPVHVCYLCRYPPPVLQQHFDHRGMYR